MASVLMAAQLVACAALIFGAVVLSWHAGNRFWSR
jgi:hypothetical protein